MSYYLMDYKEEKESFDFDGDLYLFDPEYKGENLDQMEEDRGQTGSEAERQQGPPERHVAQEIGGGPLITALQC